MIKNARRRVIWLVVVHGGRKESERVRGFVWNGIWMFGVEMVRGRTRNFWRGLGLK